MNRVLHHTAVTVLVLLALLPGALLFGLMVSEWSHVVNYLCIFLGISGIACLTLWSN